MSDKNVELSPRKFWRAHFCGHLNTQLFANDDVIVFEKLKSWVFQKVAFSLDTCGQEAKTEKIKLENGYAETGAKIPMALSLSPCWVRPVFSSAVFSASGFCRRLGDKLGTNPTPSAARILPTEATSSGQTWNG